jgi:hypothetical protein
MVTTALFSLDRVGNSFGLLFWNKVALLAGSHARATGSFALIYRGFQELLRLSGAGLPATSPLMSVLPGLIGGAWIFGEKGPVNDVLNLYVMSRVLMTGAHGLGQRFEGLRSTPIMSPYRWWAMLTWGFVMWQFETKRLVAAGRMPGVASMRVSMEYIYNHGDKVQGLKGWLGGKEHMLILPNTLWAVAVVVLGWQTIRLGPFWFAEQCVRPPRSPALRALVLARCLGVLAVLLKLTARAPVCLRSLISLPKLWRGGSGQLAAG